MQLINKFNKNLYLYRFFLTFLLICLSVLTMAGVQSNFKVKVNKVLLRYNVSSFSALPGDTLFIDLFDNKNNNYIGQFENGKLIAVSTDYWQYVVPEESGHYELALLNTISTEKVVLNIFVLTPASLMKGEYLNGYRIGKYPEKAFRNDPNYNLPTGFIEVTKANQDVFVSPHFRLKQFLCKQQPDHWPKYLLLDPLLLTKLEMLIEKLGRKGIKAEHLFIMSGYRTPFYNASINNGKYSRHIYGDAADIYVDENKDGVIDDLNNDKTASMLDAEVIYQEVELIEKAPENKKLIGGMGKYKKTASHTWDVHVDTRGYRARW